MGVQPSIREIGPYRILDELGRGGMGIVYRAVEPNLGKTFAIKILKEEYAGDKDIRERFYREARSIANLQHKNLVTVYSLGHLDGNPYIVMEYLDGTPASEIISSRRPISIADKLDLVIQVCEGLQYAHDHNLIHRDIKPSNVIVSKDGTAKIVDFGIARLGGNNTLTQTGELIGSLWYMSPEQINSSPTDQRSDIFSTGVMLYELLAYVVPFKGGDANSTFTKILRDDPPPLSRSGLEFPPELEEVVRRALAKKVEDRYQSAEEFGFDLLQVQKGLKQGRVAELLQRAEAAMLRGDLERAKLDTQEILKIDRQNDRANKLLRQVRQTIQRQQTTSQIIQLRSQAQVALAGAQYQEALTCAEQALGLNPEDQDSVRLRDEIRDAISRVKAVQEALNRAESALYAGDFDDAKAAINEALGLDPSDSQAKALLGVVNKELAERSRRLKVRDFVDSARKGISERRFTEAVDALRQAEELDPADSNIRELLQWAQKGQEQEERRKDLQQITSQIDEALRQADFASACTLCEMGLTRFPGEPSLLKLKDIAEKQRDVAQRRKFVQEQSMIARRLLDQGQCEQAIELLTAALRKYPAEPNLEKLLLLSTAEKERLNRQRSLGLKVQNLIDIARREMSERKFAIAIDALRQAEALDPANLSVRELLQQIQKEQEEERRREALQQTILQVEDFIRKEDFDSACRICDTGLERFPEEASLVKLKVIARGRQEAAQGREFVQKQSVTARQLLDQGHPEQAVELLTAALRRHPAEPSLEKLLAVATAEIEHREREREAERARRQEIQNFVDDAKREVSEGRLSNAVAALSQAEELDPANLEVRELLRQTKREQEQEQSRKTLQQIILQIEGFVQNEDFASASSVCEMGLARFPADPALLKLQAKAATLREINRKRQFVQEQSLAAQRLLEQGHYERAVELLTVALRRYPAEANFEKLLLAARAEIERREREKDEVSRRDATQRAASIRRQQILQCAERLRCALDSREEVDKALPISEQLRQLLAAGQVDDEVRAICSPLLEQFGLALNARDEALSEIQSLRRALDQSPTSIARFQAGERALAIQAAHPSETGIRETYAEIAGILQGWNERRETVLTELDHTAQLITQVPLGQIEELRDRANAIAGEFATDPDVSELLQQIQHRTDRQAKTLAHVLQELRDLGAIVPQTRALSDLKKTIERGKVISSEHALEPAIAAAFKDLLDAVESRRSSIELAISRTDEIGNVATHAATQDDAERNLADAKEFAAKYDFADVHEIVNRLSTQIQKRRGDRDLIVHELSALCVAIRLTQSAAELSSIENRAEQCRANFPKEKEIAALCDQLETDIRLRRGELSADRGQNIPDTSTRAAERDDATLRFPIPVPPDTIVGTKPPTSWKLRTLTLAAAVLAISVAAVLIHWWLIRSNTYLNVRTNPGAEVLVVAENISGRALADGTLLLKVPAGSHRVQVSLADHETKTESVIVRAGERYQLKVDLQISSPPPPKIELPLTPTGNLLVRSSVTDADVYVDREFKGSTGHDKQLKIELNEGSYRVQVKKSGYEDAPEQQIKIAAKHDTSAKLFKLPKKLESEQLVPPEVVLTVRSIPGAQVRVGEQSRIVGSSGVVAFKVRPGAEPVQASLSGYKTFSSTLTLKAGEPREVDARMPVAEPSRPNPVAPSGTFTASPGTIQEGQSVTLTWNVTNATAVSIEGVDANLGPSGSRQVTPRETTTYKLTSTGPGGTTPYSATVTVEAAAKPAVLEFTASPEKVRQGDPVTLSWQTNNATEVSISGVGNGLGSSGSLQVTPTKNTNYALIARGPGGETTKTSQVIVEPKQEVVAPPPPQNSKELPSDIKAALDALRDAYESMTIAEVQKIWPALSGKKRKDLNENLFQKARALKMRLANCKETADSGNNAKVECAQTLTYTIEGQRPTRTTQVIIKLEKTATGWQVNDVSGQQ